MPLFFFISGYLFNTKKYKDIPFIKFLKKNFLILIVPYFLIAIVTYIYWIIFEESFFVHSFKRTIFGIIYTLGYPDYIFYNAPLWFLPCLFFTRLLFFSIKKYILLLKHQLILLTLCFLFGLFLSNSESFFFLPKGRLPWGMDTALVAISFYSLGNFTKQLKITQFFQHLPKKYISLPILFTIIIYLTLFLFFISRTAVDMNTNAYHKELFFFAIAILNIYAFILLGIWIKRNKILDYFAQNSLAIMGFHMSVFALDSHILLHNIISTIFPFFNQFDLEKTGFYVGTIESVAAILVMPFMIFIVNNLFPTVIGKPYPNPNHFLVQIIAITFLLKYIYYNTMETFGAVNYEFYKPLYANKYTTVNYSIPLNTGNPVLGSTGT